MQGREKLVNRLKNIGVGLFENRISFHGIEFGKVVEKVLFPFDDAIFRITLTTQLIQKHSTEDWIWMVV